MARTTGERISAILGPILSVVYFLVPPPRGVKRPCPLIDAVTPGDMQQFRSLLAQGADPNSRQTQITGRHWMRSFVVDLPDNVGKTALMLAASGGHKEIVRLILEFGADINAVAGFGDTALTHVIGDNALDSIVRLLVDRGADVKLYGFEPALTTAATNCRTSLVRLLLEAGANVNAADQGGYTALMEAADSGCGDVVATLIAADADVNASNNEGITALDLATKQRRARIVALLKGAGATERDAR